MVFPILAEKKEIRRCEMYAGAGTRSKSEATVHNGRCRDVIENHEYGKALFPRVILRWQQHIAEKVRLGDDASAIIT